MSSARAKSAFFWSILLIGGLIPAVAQSAGTVPASQNGLNGPSPKKYLTQDEALSLIPDLKISITQDNSNRTAVLTGMVPPDCANKVSVDSSTLDSNLTDPAVKASTEADVSVGFAIHDNGGFVSCVERDKKNGYSCSNTAYACASLSQIGSGTGIALPQNESVAVSYLNKQNNDAALGDDWNGVSTQVFLSSAMIAAQRAAAEAKAEATREARVQAAILKCAQSPDGINDARDALAGSGLSQDTIDDLTSKIDALQKKYDDQKLKSLNSEVQQAIANGQTDKFGDSDDDTGLLGQVYDYYNSQKDNDPDAGNKVAQMVYNMANTLAKSDSATDKDIDKAQKMLNDALDEDSGLNLSDANRRTFQEALDVELPNRRVEIAYQACDEGGDQFYYDVKSGNSMTEMNDYNSAEKACQNANKLYDNRISSIDKQMKSSNCSAMSMNTSTATSLFGNNSAPSSSGSGGKCQELSQEASELSQGIENVSTATTMEAEQAIQQRMPTQLPGANLLSGMGGASSLQQLGQASQLPMVGATNSFVGAPPQPQFSNPFMPQVPGTMPGMMPGMMPTAAPYGVSPYGASPYGYSGYYI